MFDIYCKNGIYYDEEFLTNTEISLLKNKCDEYNWVLTGCVRLDDNNHKFWHKNLINCQYIQNLFKTKVESFLNKRIETLSLYANGNTCGQSGLTHCDEPKDTPGEYYSLVYYMHENWKPEYGGHLIIMDMNEKILENIFPKSNSAVLFDSRMPHCPLQPTVHCHEMRISIAYKFRVI